MKRQVIEYYITTYVGMDMMASNNNDNDNDIECLDELDEQNDDIKKKYKMLRKKKSKQLIDLDEECQ